jgi:hypothetical protein
MFWIFRAWEEKIEHRGAIRQKIPSIMFSVGLHSFCKLFIEPVGICPDYWVE